MNPQYPKFENAVCREIDPEIYYVEGSSYTKENKLAKTLCFTCKDIVECREWAVFNYEFGVWGGTTDQERRSMRRRRIKTQNREKVA